MKEIKHIVYTDVIVGETRQLSITEFESRYDITVTLFQEMLEEGLFQPQKIELETVYLDLAALRRIQVAIRLHQDLRVNMPGAVLALELMEELEELRRELALIHRE